MEWWIVLLIIIGAIGAIVALAFVFVFGVTSFALKAFSNTKKEIDREWIKHKRGRWHDD